MKTDLAAWPCSLARALDVFGDSWTILVLRDAMQGLARFDDFQRSLNISRNTLSDRLSRLVEAGVMSKRLYQDHPPRYEYPLTEMGRDFFPALAAILTWGDRWLDHGRGAPVTLHHRGGHDVVGQVVCLTCGQVLTHADVTFRVGPGYPDDVDPRLDMRDRLAPGAPATARTDPGDGPAQSAPRG